MAALAFVFDNAAAIGFAIDGAACTLALGVCGRDALLDIVESQLGENFADLLEDILGGSSSGTGIPAYDGGTCEALPLPLPMSSSNTQTQTGEQTQTDDTNDNSQMVFYRGNTYYDLLRTRDEPIEDVIDVLSQRQQHRDIEQGVFYTSVNRDVALAFGFIEAGNRPGQGGVGLMTIVLSSSDFLRISAAYGVVHNQPIEGLPPAVPQPHVETLFPFTSLPDLFTVSLISVELIPM